MSHTPIIKFVQKPTIASELPFPSVSTSLWLANVVDDGGDLRLNYDRYIYVHRDDVGRVTGISVSKSMLVEHPNLTSQHLTGDLVYAVLLFYIDEIEAFCELWADEFEQFFLLRPDEYFEAAIWR